jgi:hypothetical protein
MVKAIIERSHPDAKFFWEDVAMLLELLQPFSDAIHQLEADRPMLGQCYVVVTALHQHVTAFAAKYKHLRDGSIVLRLQETFQRRHDAVGGSVHAPIFNPAYAAAYMLDPYYAVLEKNVWRLPDIHVQYLDAVVELVQRSSGPEAVRQLRQLLLSGYPKEMAAFVEVVAASQGKPAAVSGEEPPSASEEHATKKRKVVAMPPMADRIRIWEKYGTPIFPNLVNLVVKLMSCHATACATERNWSLWGRIYSAARNALGMERAKKMIAICTNTRGPKESDFSVSLAVVEGNI